MAIIFHINTTFSLCFIRLQDPIDKYSFWGRTNSQINMDHYLFSPAKNVICLILQSCVT